MIDEWGEPVHLAEVLDIPARRRLEIDRDTLTEIITRQEGHIAANTHGPDPAPPEEILGWARDRLAVIEGRLAALGDS